MLEHYDAVVPEIAGLVQPLHAVYRKRCLAAINAMIAQGEARLVQIVDAVSVRKVGERELRAIDPDLRSFINVNTPEDYQRALRLVSATS
jgi:molybdenum cofactor guanylyltransferase